MRNSIPAEQWEENLLFLQQLRNKIAALPVCKHPAIELLNNGKIDKASLTKSIWNIVMPLCRFY